MFQPGEKIVYGTTGVCTVQEVTPRDDLPGTAPGTLYYALEPLSGSGIIYLPVDATVFMRPVITRQEAEALVARIPEMAAEAYHQRNLQMLRNHYQEVLQSHDCEKLLELTMSIHVKEKQAIKAGRKLGQIDARFQKRAEELLWGELAAALEIPVEAVPRYIQEKAGR